MTLTMGTYAHNGNPKLGTKVSVVNRQAGTSCPGASEWCKICYAKNGNFLRFNLQEKFGAKELVLPTNIRDVFRFHVSGDFDTVDYINTVIDYVKGHPNTKFFAYTRSWNVPELLPALESLRVLPNFQLFASCDTTMPEPPTSWRVAFIGADARFTGMTCLEQACSRLCPPDCNRKPKDGHKSKMPDCQACTYCFRKPSGNVRFIAH